MKKILSVILCLGILLTTCLFGHASAVNDFQELQSNDKYEDRVNSFVQAHEGDSYSISDFIFLYDSENNPIARCYFLQPEGYIIIDINMEIIEAAFSNTKSCQSLKEQNSDMIYYGGPLSYYKKNEKNFCNIMSNKLEEQENVNDQIEYFSIKIKENKSKSSMLNTLQTLDPVPLALTTNKLPGTLRTYSYNTGVICGSTAAAILLMYYRDYRDSWVVPSWHDTATGQSLIELLVPEINGNPPQGAFCSDVVNGLNYYFRWRGISNSYSATWANIGDYATAYNTFLSLIKSNRPIECLINSHPKYGNHFVVAHGVELELHGNSRYYYIYAGDGWGSNNVIIAFSYLREYAYVNK